MMNKELQKEYDAMGLPFDEVMVNKVGASSVHDGFALKAASAYHANQQTIADLTAKVERLRGRLTEFVEAYDKGYVEISSEKVSRNQDIPPHPWHEEWVYLAKEALEEKGGMDLVGELLKNTPLLTDETVQAVADANKEINEGME